MNKLIWIIPLVLCQSVWANVTSASNQLSQLLARYDNYQAHFSQVTKDNHARIVQKSTGLFYLKRPSKYSWQQQTPSKQIITSDGKFVWNYDVDLMQVTKQALNKSALNPALILTRDFKTIAHKFNIQLLAKIKGRTVFKLTPNKSAGGFKSVTLTFSLGQLSQLQLVNNLGQLSDFKFSHIKINSHLSPALFQFKVPKGVEVLLSK